MKLAPETREILSQYKSLINERRKKDGLSTLKTEQIVDEICAYMICQCAVYIGGVYLNQRHR